MVREFKGQYRFLSNFYPAEVVLDGKVYPTVEHAFQAAKTLNPVEREKIRRAKSPAEARKLGRRVKLRKDWESVKVSIMRDLVMQKFTRHPELTRALLMTGDQRIVEGNVWGDTFWGVDLRTGRGQNMLGRILMEVREMLRKGEKLYAGIGSRRLSAQQLTIIRQVGEGLAKLGWTLVTGAAKGADQAFAEGALAGGGKVILCLPWNGYEVEWVERVRRQYGERVRLRILDPDKDKAAMQSVSKYHPAPYRLSQGAKKLHARNYLIIHRARFVLAWPLPPHSGTEQGMRIAQALGIPVYNLNNEETLDKILKRLRERLAE